MSQPILYVLTFFNNTWKIKTVNGQSNFWDHENIKLESLQDWILIYNTFFETHTQYSMDTVKHGYSEHVYNELTLTTK